MGSSASDVQRGIYTLTLRKNDPPNVSSSSDSVSSLHSASQVQRVLSAEPTARTTPNNVAWLQAETKEWHEALTVIGAPDDLHQKINTLSGNIDRVVEDYGVILRDMDELPSDINVRAYVEQARAQGRDEPGAGSRGFRAYPLLSSPRAKGIVTEALDLLNEVSAAAIQGLHDLAVSAENESHKPACVRILKSCARILLANILAATIMTGGAALAYFFAPTALVACTIVAGVAIVASIVIGAAAVWSFSRIPAEERRQSALEYLQERAREVMTSLQA
ncbi:MAG: hypothetical protein WDO68_04280 [Gammaproteobacteria bacterium]